MVKPIKQFEISSLKVSGFKCFAEERSFSFGPMNAIFGHNAQGKSTIADAISYAITGVSFFGWIGSAPQAKTSVLSFRLWTAKGSPTA